METRLIQIGNSRGIRLPRELLARYSIGEGSLLELEEKREGILIRPKPIAMGKLSWEASYAEMAAEATEADEWADWDGTVADGLSPEPGDD